MRILCFFSMILGICLILHVLLDYGILVEKYPSESVHFSVCYRMYDFEHFDMLYDDLRRMVWILWRFKGAGFGSALRRCEP